MPIRINLLAESRAQEDQRRRDPVKRATWAGAALVVLAIAACVYLQMQVMVRKGELNRVASQLGTRTNEFQQVIANQRHLSEVTRKLGALHSLATNRLLYGTLLNTLQQTTIDDVQLVRFRAEQSYALAEEVKPKTNPNDRVIPGRPATSTERIVLTFDARDTGPNPGDQVSKLKKSVADCPYFQGIVSKTNELRLTSLSPPQALDGKAFVQFTLECRYPERTR